jgi:hypothetical protein
VVIPAMNALNDTIQFLTKNTGVALALLGAFRGGVILKGGPVGAALGFLGGAALGFLPNQPNAAANIGTGKARLATEETLAKIERNTAQLTPLVQQVIGGPGTVARGAFTFRDARMAFGI